MWNRFLTDSPLPTPTRGRAAVLWAIAAFAFGQLALIVVLERWRPDLCDPEYGWRLDRLQKQIAAEPERPLVVALGSSRVGCGLRPEALPPCCLENGKRPLVFNMSLTSGGPVMDLLCLRRLLDRGIHPQYLLVEVLSPNLYWDGWKLEHDVCLPPYRLRWNDLRCLGAYSPRPWIPYRKWGEEQMTPWFSNRFCLLSRYLPKWVPNDTRIRESFWDASIDRFGWVKNPLVTVTPEQYRQGVDLAYRGYGAPFDPTFHVSPIVDRVLRELLDTCRQEGITAALLLMPEGSDFRGWYSPGARANIDTYLDGLCSEYSIPLVDASRWLPDDCFSDSHHLLPRGADRFTERLGREVLPAFLAGKLGPGRR